MTRSIIKLVAYSVPVAHHEHYAALKDQFGIAIPIIHVQRLISI